MDEARWSAATSPVGGAASAKALVVTTAGHGDLASRLGQGAYSYAHVQQAFRPLLERYATVIDVDRPESRLDAALERARRVSPRPLHLSFTPIQAVYPSALAPTVAVPFWEFPDIPNDDFNDNPRNNWVRVASRLAGLICASDFTRDAFARAGVRTPAFTVPVPIADAYFAVPPPTPGAHHRLPFPAHLRVGADVTPRVPTRAAALVAARAAFDSFVQPRLPAWLDRSFGLIGLRVRELRRSLRHVPPDVAALELSGVVFTAVVNPFDERKNWRDLLTAFLIGLADADDATLVLKLAVGGSLRDLGVAEVLDVYESLGLRHRCRLAVVSEYLAPDEMVALTAATTFAVSASHAEGYCLPLRDALAAGRPLVAPCHSGLRDVVDERVGFVVDSHPEPTHWPHDLRKRLTTSWHRLVWQSLHDQLRAAYRLATTAPERYRALGAHGRERMRALAGAEQVWPRLRDALDAIDGAAVR